jgi:hypothetical protein
VGFFLRFGYGASPLRIRADVVPENEERNERYFGSGKYGVASSGSGTLKTSRIIETPV